MSASRLPRSYLFVPGNRPERFAKACATGADAVIFDLEDAVPTAEKEAARSAVADWLNSGPQVACQLLIRINSADTIWFGNDLALCGIPAVDGIVLPKAERVQDLERLRSSGARAILPLIETAVGFQQAGTLAQVSGVQRLVFGTIDFQVDLGIEGEDDELLYFRSQLVLLSRLAGVHAPVDGVTTALDDDAVLSSDTLRGKRIGFGAKLCIHPKQVAGVNQGFTPTKEEIEWAQRVLAAAAAANGGAVALDGKMVDKPVILKAQRIVAQAE
ncbi:CoA ester lyase [Herbaspirillum sp. RTI4]|uniref:HpcH/HpaI aldolase/citrate lyase family protein n=1 Tax=Herbaspirillum sp. RTI4 TaxID=3048640 RepID=UPI002AB3F578|nr:CoA ester lyase [Herbaspirillum sp. RTI4]MDY7576996.1 CoA ester lyase [Herbaspirillum sp. RTI4]MEA9982101.1 CoA ester lyase [Herbaspirillum sp. RTI4]